MKEKKRVEYFDVYRGIGILFMIMGHVYFGSHFDKFIHAFHMPMFFFLTGYFYRKNDGKLLSTICNKTRTLIFPYFMFGIIDIGLYSIINKQLYPDIIKHFLWDNTDGMMVAGALWFLTALFASIVIYNIIDCYVVNTKLKSVLIFAISLFGNVIGILLPKRLPWALDVAFVAVGFIHIGRIFKQKQLDNIVSKLTKLDLTKLMLLTVMTGGMIFINGTVNLREGAYSRIPMFWLNAVLSIIVLLNWSIYICEISQKAKLITALKNVVAYIGENSLLFLCANQLIIYCYNLFIPDNFSILFSKVIVFVATVITLIILNIIVSNTKIMKCFK